MFAICESLRCKSFYETSDSFLNQLHVSIRHFRIIWMELPRKTLNRDFVLEGYQRCNKTQNKIERQIIFQVPPQSDFVQ